MQRRTLEIQKEKNMLGTFNGKLDKTTCIISLAAISLITFAIGAFDLYSLINISGVFKQ